VTGDDGPSTPRGSVAHAYRRVRAWDLGTFVLRLGLGAAWALNLIYIFDPANQFFTTFSATATSFGPTSLGGHGLASFVAAYPEVFSGVIAGLTVYLSAAFLLGLTTRVACLVGGAFNLALLLTQFGQISTFPGSTDIGAQPLYLVIYAALFFGRLETLPSVDRLVGDRLRKRQRLHSGLARRLGNEAQPLNRA